MPLEKRPNILLVVADDHRADAIGTLGHPVVHTPTLDGLIERGTIFTNTRIMGSLIPAVCAPSRACLLTGRNLFQADGYTYCEPRPSNDVPIHPEYVTLPQYFREHNYETFITGKWHNDGPSAVRSFESGRNIFHGGMSPHDEVPVRSLSGIKEGRPAKVAEGFSSEVFCNTAIDFLQNHDKSRPFFMWLALTSPHDPRTPPPPYDTLYDQDSIPLPLNFLPEHPFDNGELSIRDELLAPHPRTGKTIQKELADYYGLISHHDACLGRVLDCLSRTGLEEGTIVVYVSDHGLAIGSHGLLGKQNLYEHSVRVPFILSGPGVPKGLRSSHCAYSLDLFSTLCELSKVPVLPNLESRSLVPILADKSDNFRDVFFSVYSGFQRSVYDGRWKLICYAMGGEERLQLFDLLEDPLELYDRIEDGSCSAIVQRLLDSLQEWQNVNGDPTINKNENVAPHRLVQSASLSQTQLYNQ
ncbi:sulfatase-like hydrolase/transferase [Puniceicoccus vermicola]|uniref:Sulfatase-like hydrolase/transferase n=1 Tax=Puniceicoccus vermicola TaxID=388746 RepID=A0A7X1E5R6_9BACT|nr:sulfatase-like hydrolase/transferase [Puniceicoccus vermicola]MBC2603441.1 sulfatase-like hydrolase/transferase [Puniceicoccus vermicola]